MPDYSAGSASVEIKPDFTGFVRRLRQDLDRVNAELAVDIEPSLAGFTERLRTELQRIDAGVTVDVRPNFNRREFEAVLATYRPTVYANIVPALDQTAFARIDELLNRLARDRTANIRPNVGGLSGVSGSADRATRSLTAMSAVKFTGLAAGITALVPILLGAVGAAGGLVAALGALGGVGAIGGSGIIGAFSAMKDSTEGAGAAAEKAANDLDQVADAQQRVIDAQHNEMDALQSVEDAQKSLTQAKIDARDAQDNLNLAVKNGALTEKGAELAYRRAVVALNKTRRDAATGKASGLDVETAQHAVDEAAQNITNVRVGNQQTKAKADDANAKGIEGSDQVQAAQRQLESAQYGVTQSQVQTAQAVRDLAKAQDDAAQSAAAAAGNTDKLQQALAKLSPNARDFVLQMQALGPAWKDLRLAVQDNLFAGLGDSMTQLANNQMPALKDGLSQIAGGLNSAIKDTLSSLDGLFTELVNNGSMQGFIDGINAAMQGIAPLVTGLTSSFITLGEVVGPHLGPFFAALGKMISDISGPLGQIGGVFLDTLTALMPTLTQLINAMSTGLAPILPVVGRLFDSIGQALIPLIPSISRIVEIIGNALADAIVALAPYLPTIAQAFADILAAVAPLITPLAQLIGVIAGAIATNLSSLATALAPVITQLAEGLTPVIPILTNAFAQLTPVFAQIAATIGTALVSALEKILPVLPELIQSWSNLMIALVPLLPVIVDLAVQILPVLADILVRLAPFLVTLLNHITDLVNYVVPILIPAMEKWKDTMVGAWDKIKGAWDGMKAGLDQLRDKFSGVVDKIKEIWTGLTDVFKAGGLGGVAGKVVDKALDLIPGHATGGLVTGEGTSTSDSILARLSDREFVVNARSAAKYMPLLEAINTDQVPGFAEGGAVRGPNKKKQSTGQSAIVSSMADVVAAKFPGMTLTSGQRNTDNGHHTQGKAADFSNGSDDTPEMQALASFIATNYPQSLELIHQPFGHNIKDGKDVGDGLGVYGAATMGQHRNHVHWAVGSVISAPAATPSTVTPASPQAANDPSNYSNGTYIGPSSVDTSKDVQADSGLPEEYSAQGIGAKAGSILAEGLLGIFGLENSVLSSSNPYNKALNTTVDYYSQKQQTEQDDPGTLSTTAPATTAPAPAAPPAKHTYQPGAGAEQWRDTVLTVLRGTGRSDGLADRTIAQIGIESGGNPNAQNNYDINAKNGTPSIGLLQVIKPTFDSNIDGRYPGGQQDPEANIAAAFNYVDKRYGGAAKIWPTTAGYAGGGWVFGQGSGTSDSNLARLSNGEFVVNAAAAAANGDVLQAINSGLSLRAPSLPAGLSPRGGDTSNTTRDHSVNFNGDVHVMNHDQLVREQDRWATNQSMGALAAYS
ncbi:transglycosylase SLT domain-containing protein [Nocardia australiensis]|uniref:transglycosylase SLT domain-containing protein n=1 Tax=Nocardia australiensis TaxID=2887191 RepID=UPI001D156098|nr:transglycosylase SLT domain-containing protein [Nocardia australiensis]